MSSAFINIEDGKERRTASLMLGRYHAQIATWQRQADELVANSHKGGKQGLNAVDLLDYLGYSKAELAEFRTLEEFQMNLEARRGAIDESVALQRERMREREQRRIHPGERQGRRGRPRLNLLKYGQYVYFATAYNHGQGAGFEGYGPGGAEKSSLFAPTDINEWENFYG